MFCSTQVALSAPVHCFRVPKCLWSTPVQCFRRPKWLLSTTAQVCFNVFECPNGSRALPSIPAQCFQTPKWLLSTPPMRQLMFSNAQMAPERDCAVFLLCFIEFSRVFSTLGTCRAALPTAPGGSRRPAGGFEPAQEGFSVASSGLKSAPKWPRDE